MANRTREKLIEVARHLFAKKGVKNTTMIDIANASDKGRRTVYTYFKSKRAIYDAVIESECEKLIGRLESVTKLDLPPLEKFYRFIIARFDVITLLNASTQAPADGGIKSWFVHDNHRLERVMATVFQRERVMLNGLLRECLDDPRVDRRQVVRLRVVIPLLQQGVDITYVRRNYKELGVDEASFPDVLAAFVINGLLKKEQQWAPMPTTLKDQTTEKSNQPININTFTS